MLQTITSSVNSALALTDSLSDTDLLPIGLAALWFDAPYVERNVPPGRAAPRSEWSEDNRFWSFGMALKYVSAQGLGLEPGAWSAPNALRALNALAPGCERANARLVPWSGRLLLCIEAPFHPSAELTAELACDAPEFSSGRRAFARAVGSLRPGAFVPIDHEPEFHRCYVRPFLGSYQAGAVHGERALDWSALLASPALRSRIQARSEAVELAALSAFPRGHKKVVRL